MVGIFDFCKKFWLKWTSWYELAGNFDAFDGSTARISTASLHVAFPRHFTFPAELLGAFQLGFLFIHQVSCEIMVYDCTAHQNYQLRKFLDTLSYTDKNVEISKWKEISYPFPLREFRCFLRGFRWLAFGDWFLWECVITVISENESARKQMKVGNESVHVPVTVIRIPFGVSPH